MSKGFWFFSKWRVCSIILWSVWLVLKYCSECVSVESKSTNDASRDQPVTAVVSSTTSNAESSTSTSKLEEELKVSSRLRKFTFNDLKLATRNFRPESLLGEGGFGCVFKGWIEENGTAPVKPGTGLTVAVKTLNHDGLQGHKEWLVCYAVIFFSFSSLLSIIFLFSILPGFSLYLLLLLFFLGWGELFGWSYSSKFGETHWLLYWRWSKAFSLWIYAPRKLGESFV